MTLVPGSLPIGSILRVALDDVDKVLRDDLVDSLAGVQIVVPVLDLKIGESVQG